MQELNLRTLIGVLLQNLRWIFLFALVLALIVGGYNAFFVPDTYASTCSMYILNLTSSDNGTASMTTGISTSGLSASQQMVNEYSALLKSDMIIDDVAASLQERGFPAMTNKQIRATLKMSPKDETALLEIRSTSTDPDLCQAICDAIMECAPDKIKETMLDLGTVNPVDYADRGVRVNSGALRSAAIGGVISGVLAYAFFLLLHMLDNTIKSEQDLRVRLNVTVLGSVPDLHPGQKKTKKGEVYYGR